VKLPNIKSHGNQFSGSQVVVCEKMGIYGEDKRRTFTTFRSERQNEKKKMQKKPERSI
jgi:hypothetical protein